MVGVPAQVFAIAALLLKGQPENGNKARFAALMGALQQVAQVCCPPLQAGEVKG